MDDNRAAPGATSIARPDIPVFLQYLLALLTAVLLLLLIAAFSNFITPFADAAYYFDMARDGITGNPNLVAPFAYRPGMPYLSRTISGLLDISLLDGFRVAGWISAFLFLAGCFILSRFFTKDFRPAVIPMILLGLSFYHVKFPFSLYPMADVAAYPLMIFSFWALITGRFFLCLLLSCAGVLFKEFLAIPLFLLFIQLGREYRRTRSRARLLQLSLALCAGMGAILVPRLYIPVIETLQSIDPINDPSTLRALITTPFDMPRTFNIIFSIVSYWLPALLFMTRSRLGSVWAGLKGSNVLMLCGVYLLLDLFLTMYGGMNIPIFVSYSAGVQVVVLALLLRNGIGVTETFYAVFAVLVYNRVLLQIPLPEDNLYTYIDFYGGWASRVNATTFMRFLECGILIAGSTLIRFAASRIPFNDRKAA